MHSRPFFSMPTDTVEAQIAKIKSKVQPELLHGRTEWEKMLINQSDIGLQQNETLARAADEIHKALDLIQEQTTLTNGRVNKAEKDIKDHDEILKGYQKASARRTKVMTTCIPFIVVGLEIIAKKLGWL